MDIKTRTHYENVLAEIYDWAFGGLECNIKKNYEYFKANSILPDNNAVAVDLGAGSGFQSIPLARLGFEVYSVDFCEKILNGLVENSKGLSIQIVKDDITNFANLPIKSADLVVCMGDTLTHLASLAAVKTLFENVYNLLVKNGRFILSYRDLTDNLKGLDRFIPVRADENRIFTCFLENFDGYVNVNDLIYKNENENWKLYKSSYKKLKLPKETVEGLLKEIGFINISKSTEGNFITEIWEKN